MKKIIPLIALLALVAAACGDAEASDTTDTTAADGTRSPAYVESVEFQYLESYPVQVRAVVSGNLPTPCHELQWSLDESDPDAPVLEMWSTADPEAVCAQVLEPFEEVIPIGSYETGSYTLTLDGESYPFEI